MKLRILALTILISILPPTLLAQSSRTFDLDTTTKLGESIYEQENLVIRAIKTLGKDLKGEGIVGWVAKTGEQQLIRFVKKVDNQFVPSHNVRFDGSGKGHLETPKGQLSRQELAQFLAGQQITKELPESCSKNYRAVVLDDPDGNGFLVYALPEAHQSDKVFFGGYYRLTVSADGQKVEATDKLFDECQTETHEQSTFFKIYYPQFSPTPVETHVYMCHRYDTFMTLSTPDGTKWTVRKTGIQKLKPVPR